MAQTSQSEETRSPGETTDPGAGRLQGLFGTSTTILLVIAAVAVFWWNRRRRVEMEERLRIQRQEAEEAAERSALDVAHLMRAGSRSAAAAVAGDGPSSATGMPSARDSQPTTEAMMVEKQATAQEDATESGRTPFVGEQQEGQARAIERAEARAAAERVAEEQAERAARDAETTGESVARRMAAASAAAQEVEADAADAERGALIAAIPADAVVGDGTGSCPPDYPIKGNRQSRIYHRPDQVSYPSTIAEYCFASAEAAELAGFRESRAREQRSHQ
jgi:hypothetical protein